MCTSFIKKEKGNYLIGMNFDNNGMKYKLVTKNDWFIGYVEVGKMMVPSFGVHKSGLFFNNQCVESNGKGEYRRGKNVVHSTKFLLEIINHAIDVENLNSYLQQHEIVNVPNWSTHNLIVKADGTVWIIEPGRGNKYLPLTADEFQVITNESILDYWDNQNYQCNRYLTVNDFLAKNEMLTKENAFQLLQQVSQTGPEWVTDLTLVYDKKKNTVYYQERKNLDKVAEYQFK